MHQSGILNPAQQAIAKQAITRLNKINHIFNKAEHKLGDFVESCGSNRKAFDKLEHAFKKVAKGRSDGVFEASINIDGFNITVRGSVVNGLPKIGTAFAP